MDELRDKLTQLCQEKPKGSLSKIRKIKKRLRDLGWEPTPKEKKTNGRANVKGRVSKKALKKREKEWQAHIKRLEEQKEKARKTKEMTKITHTSNHQPAVKQSQPKGESPLKGTKGFDVESKKSRDKRLRAEYSEWNKEHMAKVEELRKQQDDGELIMEWPRVPRKYKKRHTQSKKHKVGTYKKVSNLPKGKEVDHYKQLLETIEKRNERLANNTPVTHKVVGKSSHSLVCITDGVMVHRLPRQLAELIIERVKTKKGEAIWSYTTKGTWKAARAKGNAGTGFDPINPAEHIAKSEAKRKEIAEEKAARKLAKKKTGIRREIEENVY